MPQNLFLVGVRSPLVVDYEETCERLCLSITAGVSLSKTTRMLNRDRVITLADLADIPGEGEFYPCAFHPRRRAELARIAENSGLIPAGPLIDPTAVMPKSSRAGSMSFINAATAIGGATFLGDRVLINRSTSIGHHCFISDDVSIAPGVTLAGNVKVGSGTIIGVGSTVLPGITIGIGAIVAAGSLVRDDVANGTFVAGSPAVPIPFDPSKSVLGNDDDE